MASDEQRRSRHQLSRLAAFLLMQAALASAGGAQETEAPDLELLAYLGSWQGDDEEWLAVAEWDSKSEAQGSEPEPPREEKDDE